MAFCGYCGTQLSEGAKFCPKCGNPVGEVSEDTREEINENVQDASYVSTYEEPWYSVDFLQFLLRPIIKSFDDGSFFLAATKGFIGLISFSFLISQPWQAYMIFKNDGLHYMDGGEKFVAFIFALLWLLFAIFSYGYWMKRSHRMDQLYNPKDEFVVIPLGSYYLQWFGEWVALLLGFGGIIAIIVSIIVDRSSSFVMLMVESIGWYGGIIALASSILIAYLTRIIAEKLRSITSIANNTGRMLLNQTESAEKQTDSYFEDSDDTYTNVLYLVCALLTIGFMLAAMIK